MFDKMFNLSQYTVPADEFGLDTETDNGPLAIRNPGKMDFFRVNNDPAYRATVNILTDTRAQTTYIVAPSMKSELEGDISTAVLVLAANQDGEVFLWLAKRPAFENEPFGTTRMAAISQAQATWVRLRARADRQGYDIIPAAKQFGEPQWPGETLDELCRESFADRFIADIQHPVIKRLRGESL